MLRNSLLRTYLVAFAVIASALGAQAQPAPANVAEYVTKEMAKQEIPGLALGVYRDGKIVTAAGFGSANVELDVAVKAETIFQSGSVGKQFTAAIVMMLVEEGKIGLDDSVRKYFPEAPDTWQDVKIKNLLSHTSGLTEYESDEKLKPGGPINLHADYTEESLVKLIESWPMDFRPGEKWAYRNTNYVLLGDVIHKVTGKFYGDVLQERIFKPLGMTHTRIISEADIIRNRAAGYQLVKGELKNQDWVSPFFNSTADGALYFNVLDLANWDEALYGERLLKRSSLDQMWTVFKLNDGKPNSAHYGFAWEINEVNGHRVIEHGGAWQGFTTYISRYVDDKLTVVVLTNLDSAHSDPGRIAHHVAGLYKEALMPPPPKPIDDKDPQVTARLRALVESITNGNAKPEEFAPEFRAMLFPEHIKQVGDKMRTFGPMQSFILIGRDEDVDGQVDRYLVTFGKATVEFTFMLDKQKQVAGATFHVD